MTLVEQALETVNISAAVRRLAAERAYQEKIETIKYQVERVFGISFSEVAVPTDVYYEEDGDIWIGNPGWERDRIRLSLDTLRLLVRVYTDCTCHRETHNKIYNPSPAAVKDNLLELGLALKNSVCDKHHTEAA